MPTYTRFPPKGTHAPSLAPVPEQVAQGHIEGDMGMQEVKSAIKTQRLHWIVPLLMFSLVLPVILNVGALRLSPNRLILVIMIVPVIIKWLSGAAGRIRTADILVIVTSLWMALTLVIYGGIPMIEYAGITGIEMLGPYLMARCYVRTEAQYLALIRTLRWIVLILAPLAAIEAVTRMRLVNMVFDPVFPTLPQLPDVRWGMQRAQTGFEHPILYGCFVAFVFSPIYFSLRLKATALKSFLLASPVLAATFFALSAGAYLGLVVQLLLICWGFTMRQMPNRWQVLATLSALAFIIVDVISNRTAFEVFISYLTFNSHTSYWRVLIFTYGIQNVWAHPLFGLGLGDWVRPHFMYSASVDNFWLLMAMRHGIPCFVLVASLYITVMTSLMRARPALASVRTHRMALVFSFIGLAIAIATVHLWAASFVFLMFMLGVSAWITDAPKEGEMADTPQTGGASRRLNVHTRRQQAAVPQDSAQPAKSLSAQTTSTARLDQTRNTATHRASTRPERG